MCHTLYVGERIVTVGGVSCPCGGTHVKNVADIRAVTVTKIKKVLTDLKHCVNLTMPSFLIMDHVGAEWDYCTSYSPLFTSVIIIIKCLNSIAAHPSSSYTMYVPITFSFLFMSFLPSYRVRLLCEFLTLLSNKQMS